MLFLSVNVFAANMVYGDYSLHNDHRTIWMPAAKTRDAAYALGVEKINQLKAKSSIELASELTLFLDSRKEKKSMTLDEGSNITVKESMNNKGEVVYTALVYLNYSYYKAN